MFNRDPENRKPNLLYLWPIQIEIFDEGAIPTKEPEGINTSHNHSTSSKLLTAHHSKKDGKDHTDAKAEGLQLTYVHKMSFTPDKSAEGKSNSPDAECDFQKVL